MTCLSRWNLLAPPPPPPHPHPLHPPSHLVLFILRAPPYVSVHKIGVTFYLLHREVAFAFAAGLVVIMGMIPLNAILANRIGAATRLLMVNKDDRVERSAELLHSIRVSGGRGRKKQGRTQNGVEVGFDSVLPSNSPGCDRGGVVCLAWPCKDGC